MNHLNSAICYSLKLWMVAPHSGIYLSLMPSHFSRVRLSVIPLTVARQAPLSMGLSRQEYWSGLPFPSPGDLPDPGIEPTSLKSPAMVGRFFTTICYTYLSLTEARGRRRGGRNQIHKPYLLPLWEPLKSLTELKKKKTCGSKLISKCLCGKPKVSSHPSISSVPSLSPIPVFLLLSFRLSRFSL